MKKILFFAMGIVTLSMMTACNGKSASNEAVKNDSVVVDSAQVDSANVSVTDSVMVSAE